MKWTINWEGKTYEFEAPCHMSADGKLMTACICEHCPLADIVDTPDENGWTDAPCEFCEVMATEMYYMGY